MTRALWHLCLALVYALGAAGLGVLVFLAARA